LQFEATNGLGTEALAFMGLLVPLRNVKAFGRDEPFTVDVVVCELV